MKRARLCCFLFLLLVCTILAGCTASVPPKASGALDDETLGWFETMYFNFNTIDRSYPCNMQNMMLSSEYADVREINLFSLFYNGVIGTPVPVSDEEREALTAIVPEAAQQDITKITKKQMDAVLRQNTGLTLDETAKVGLDQFLYLDEYDAYYAVHSDTSIDACTLQSGWRDADGTVHLQYQFAGHHGTVTLKRTETAYFFVSNTYIYKESGNL